MRIKTTACVNVMYLEQKTIPSVTSFRNLLSFVIAVEDLLSYEQLHQLVIRQNEAAAKMMSVTFPS